MNRLILFCALLVFTACGSVRPEFPKPPVSPVVFADPPLSEVTIPVSVDFAGASADIKSQIASAVNAVHTPGWPNHEFEQSCNLRYRYGVSYGELNFGIVSGARPIQISGQIAAGAGATFCAVCVNLFGVRCVVPKVGASCGIPPGENMRRINFGVNTSLAVNPDYSLKSDVAISDLHFVDPCRITFLNIDISGLIRDAVIARVPTATINDRIKAISVRPQAENIWNQAIAPIAIGDGLYFKLKPESWGLSEIGGQGETVKFNFGFTAKPEITTDPTPVPADLPSFGNAASGNGFNIFADVKVDYPFINKKLAEQLVGMKIPVEGNEFIIKGVEVFGLKNREMIVRIDFKGTLKGCLFLLAKPTYDAATREVKFSELKYDLYTTNLLVNALAWLAKPIILQSIGDKARIPIGNRLDDVQGKVNGYLNKTYGNITLTGEVTDLSILDDNFQALPKVLFIRTHAAGKLGVDVVLP